MSDFQSSYGLEDSIDDNDLESAALDYILNSELPVFDDLKTAFRSGRKRVSIARNKDLDKTTWGMMLMDPLTADPKSYKGKHQPMS